MAALVGGPGAEPRTLENFRKFAKKFLKKIEKCIILDYFSKKFLNYALNFCSFGRKALLLGNFWEKVKSFWWKFNWKIEFVSIFGNVFAKNRAFGNNIIFPPQFFQFRGRGKVPRVPPWRRLWIIKIPQIVKMSSYLDILNILKNYDFCLCLLFKFDNELEFSHFPQNFESKLWRQDKN